MSVPPAEPSLNIARWVSRWADEIPETDAIRCSSGAITWRQLRSEGARVARALVEIGVGIGTPVVLSCDHLPFLYGLVGVTQLGAIPVLVDPTDREWVELVLRKLPPAAAVMMLGAGTFDVATVRIDAGATGCEITTDVGRGGTAATLPANAGVVMCTSGSSGLPKLVLWTEERVRLTGLYVWLEHRRNAPEERPGSECVALVLPLTYSFGFTALLSAWRCGRAVALIDQPYATATAFAQIAAANAISTSCTPTHLELWLNDDCPAPRCLRHVLVSGGPMAPGRFAETLRRYPEVRFTKVYGTAETSIVSLLDPTEAAVHPESCGRPISTRRVTICNDAGEALPAGEHGRIVVECAEVLPEDGYVGAQSNDALRFVDGRVITNDRGYLSPEGLLFVLGRDAEILKVAGRSVSARAIEEKLRAAFTDIELVVVGVTHRRYGEAPAVIFVARERPDLAEQLAEHARRALRRDEVPVWFLARPSLPHTVAGKVRRGSLAAEVERWAQCWTTQLAIAGRLWPATPIDSDELFFIDGIPGGRGGARHGRPLGIVRRHGAPELLGWLAIDVGSQVSADDLCSAAGVAIETALTAAESARVVALAAKLVRALPGAYVRDNTSEP